jgi:hypothetical protein
MADFIQIKDENIKRFGIKDRFGNDTEEFIEFDLEDIGLIERYLECEEQHKKNAQYVKMQYVIIDKQQDKEGKKMLSWKQEEKYKVMKEYYKREMQALDLLLGENGTKKILAGRNPYWNMFDDISEALKPILSELDKSFSNIQTKIKSKYKETEDESDVLK